MLLSWLRMAEDFPDQASHQAAGQKDSVQSYPALSFEKRREARAWIEGAPELAAALAELERPRRPGESVEPEGFA